MENDFDSSSFSAKGVLAGLAGALIGAAIWTAIAVATGYMIGYVAWGVGLLVGVLAVKAGARGRTMAVTCALLALGGIAVGELLTVQIVYDREVEGFISEFAAENSDEDFYQETLVDARDYAALVEAGANEDPAALSGFLLDHGYDVELGESGMVTEASRAEWLADRAPHLVEVARDQPSFEQWQDERTGMMREVIATDRNSDILSLVVEELGPVDLLFAFLGIATAFRLVMAAGVRRDPDEEEDPEPDQAEEAEQPAAAGAPA